MNRIQSQKLSMRIAAYALFALSSATWMASSSFATGLHQQTTTATSDQATASARTVKQNTETDAKTAKAAITEDDLRKRLTGKTWYLRGAWLSDSLEFSMRGDVLDHPTTGSFTLALVRIEKVHLTRRNVELEGTRYALHFLGALPYENSEKSVEEIRITSRKKFVRLVIAREQVVKPKKSQKKKQRSKAAASEQLSDKTEVMAGGGVKNQTTGQTDPKAVTAESPAEAEQMLGKALDRIFASTMDETMLATLPEYWQRYYKARLDGHAPDMNTGGVLTASVVDRAAKLLKAVDPASNEYAQANGIAGRALYRVVVGADGKPGSIAIMRPIGFGLDENAIAAIQAATFAPAMKAGVPVAEAIDLAVMFRIYSNRTNGLALKTAATVPKQAGPILPGPYSTPQK